MKTDRTTWDASVSHPLQSWAWGEFRKIMGIDVVRIHNWQITFHTIPFTPFTIGFFPKGPPPTQTMLNELIALGKQKNAIFIQIEPDSTKVTSKISHFRSLIPSHHPLFTKYTFILDLTKSEEELLRVMSQKTRYNLRVARKHGVEVKEDNSSTAFSHYLRLNQETTSRQKFYAHNSEYHKHMWEAMREAKIAHLFTATYKGNVLATWIIFVWNKTIFYPYGASSRDHREVMAPQLMLWEIAKWGKNQGYTAFDLWGALGPNPDTNDPWYGFHRFKEGFAPTLVEFVGSFDLIIHPFSYHVYKMLDQIRWFLLKIKN